MGRGDKRTAKGKRTLGSYGNSRPQRVKKSTASAAPKEAKVKAPKKAAEAVAEKPKKAPAKKKKAESSEE